MSTSNPLNLRGIEFTEFCGPTTGRIEELLCAFGFSRTRRHPHKAIDVLQQNDIHMLLNAERAGHAASFAQAHGPSMSSMGWRVDDAAFARDEAVRRGARPADPKACDLPYPAIYGIGESLIYFIERFGERGTIWENDFALAETPRIENEKGFLRVDHLTNNVPAGHMQRWADFYKHIFGFTEVRYFDISGVKTGLTSYALRSPDGSFCIPINEPKSDKDQIAEYLREYNGPGVQHIAFLTRDILNSLDRLQGSGIQTLAIDDEYYADVFARVPGVKEDRGRIRAHNVLLDGDENGYLLQIFTKNLIGPIFIEIIQRENNLSFGEGNFGALFRSIEKDQELRGVL